jgi:hypothetical protein
MVLRLLLKLIIFKIKVSFNFMLNTSLKGIIINNKVNL